MKKINFLYVFIIFFGLKLFADETAVQVPESCAGRISPCLLRTKSKIFNFKISDVEFKIMPESIVRLSNNKNQIDVNILKGNLQIITAETNPTATYLNMVLLDSESVLAKRDMETLEILSLEKFTTTKYYLTEKSVPARVSENFLSKIEFVEFTKDFFININEYKRFLSSVEIKWTKEFQRQNESQTKALLRSIASEERLVEERVKRQIQEEQERKRLRTELFYRTFQR